MNRKTALILTGAAGLIAVAAIFTPRSNLAGTSRMATPVEPGPSLAHLCTGAAQPADQKAAFGYGDLHAALSSQKILQGSNGEMFLAVDFAAAAQKVAERPPMSLALVIDRSGSMSGEKLEQAKQAAIGMVERLTVRDRVAVVQYDDAAQVLLPSITLDAMGKARARATIERIVEGGGTNLHDGMALGRDEVLRAPLSGALQRVILLSDGNANAGIVDQPTLSQVASQASERGVRITTVGLGLDYNEDLMEALAEHGRGQYYYVQNAGELQAVFAGEFRNLQATVATNAEIRLAPACDGVDILEVYGYNTTQEGNELVVRMADIIGGDERKLVARLRAPAGVLGTMNAVRVTMNYSDAKTGAQRSAAIVVGAEISSDAAAVERSASTEVVKAAMEVESARAIREAAQAYQQGDVARAGMINRKWRDEAAKKASHYNVPAAEAAVMLDGLDKQDADMKAYSPGSSMGKDLVKGSKLKARVMSKQKR